jgi:hypothetical protein
LPRLSIPLGPGLQLLQLILNFAFGNNLLLPGHSHYPMKPIIHIIDLRQLPKPFDEFLIPAVLQILNVVSDKVQAGEG